jgi:hypothetical protein
MSKLTLVRLYHDLLGTYGDQGNAEVLMHRARARNLDVELIDVAPGQQVAVSGDIYLIGGGEDGPQAAALEMLRADGGLNRAVDSGAAVLAVCAGFQLIGSSLPSADGHTIDGLGLVDAHTIYTDDPRCVGELFVTPADDESAPLLTGFENHQGRTRLGAGTQPLGWVVSGYGNGMAMDGSDARIPEGVVNGRVIGTYMHGPVLARNPQLADQILSSVAGTLTPFIDELANDFAAERRATFRS